MSSNTQPIQPLPDTVLTEWWQPFAEYLSKERRYSKNTLRNYRQAFEDFYRWLKEAELWEKGIDALDSRDMRDFVIEAQQRYSRRTLHNHVSALRAYVKYWMLQGKLRRNPFVGIPLPKLDKPLPKFLTEAQMKKLLMGPQKLLDNESIDTFTAWRDRLVMELLYGGGLRVSELAGLNYSAIDFGSGVARVMGKGNRARLCPLGKVAIAVLQRFRENHARDMSPDAPVLITARF